jgi:hypothetical protein
MPERVNITAVWSAQCVKCGRASAGVGLLGEAITRRVAVGGLLVIAGVYAIETHPRRPAI